MDTVLLRISLPDNCGCASSSYADDERSDPG
jgi:hypothetical protein